MLIYVSDLMEQQRSLSREEWYCLETFFSFDSPEIEIEKQKQKQIRQFTYNKNIAF